jgi:tetratricopeptide (TPR) repeat protein
MLKRCTQLVIAWALLAAIPVSATTLEEVQRAWAQANYTLSGDQQLTALASLSEEIDAALAEDQSNAELLIWDGIVKSTRAGKAGGLGALKLVKAARKSLERAIKLDPAALQGSAYTSLGALYYQVPGWPLAFGDDDKARELLTKAVEVNPQGIDSNYFYGDFLAKQKEYAAARQALEKALSAPERPNRPVADAGRRAEIRALLDTLQS